jgi:hypothetical protein
VIMSPTELKIQPIIQLQRYYGRGQYTGLFYKCIVGCIFKFDNFRDIS